MGRFWSSWPRRTLWPTREGLWCLCAALGLGFVAMNTGNNLLYLLVSLLLGFIAVSGLLSEPSIRGVRVTALVPDDVHAGRPALFGARVLNGKRWRSSYSITIQVLGSERFLYIPRLGPGEERLVTWEETLPRRGRQRLRGFRVITRFPFGLFVKAKRADADTEFVVYPALVPISAARRRELGGGGRTGLRRRGRGHDLYNLRDYHPGDDPRLIHWRSSAKRPASLVVRELEADTALDTRIVLEGSPRPDPARLEPGLSEAASLAVSLLRAGAAVELAGPGVFVPLGRGRKQRRDILTCLALYGQAGEAGTTAGGRVPDVGGSVPPGHGSRRAGAGSLREVRVSLG